MENVTEKELGLLIQLQEKISDLELEEEFTESKSLVRWLRARNWKLSDTEVMIRKHIQWIKEENIDTVLDWTYPPGWKEQFPWKVTGFDLEGNPVVVVQTGRWDVKKIVDAGLKDELIRMNLHKLESLWGLAKYVSKDKKQYVQGVAIVDLEGISLRQVNSIGAFDACIKTLRNYEANYPETVKHIIILNAKWIFQIGWKVIKPFVPERTYSKIQFLGTDRQEWKDALLSIIPENQFPKYYGGSGDDYTEISIAKDGSWKYISTLNMMNENI